MSDKEEPVIKAHSTYSTTQLVVYLAVLLFWGAAISLSASGWDKNENDIKRKEAAHAEFHHKRMAYLKELSRR